MGKGNFSQILPIFKDCNLLLKQFLCLFGFKILLVLKNEQFFLIHFIYWFWKLSIHLSCACQINFSQPTVVPKFLEKKKIKVLERKTFRPWQKCLLNWAELIFFLKLKSVLKLFFWTSTSISESFSIITAYFSLCNTIQIWGLFL